MSDVLQIKPKTSSILLSLSRWGCIWLLVGALAGAQGDGCAAEKKQEFPPAQSILRSIREAQSSLHQTFQGKLRRGDRSLAYRMIMDGPSIRFEFPAATGKEPQIVVIRFGAFDATLEVRDGTGKVQPVRFEDEVAGMGVSYEDLALRFVFWPEATVEGEERVMLTKCWRIRVKRPDISTSAYREVVVWVGQTNGAFLKSEAYGNDGAVLRKLTVRSLQSLGQVTTLKQLRAESPKDGGDPVYLDVDGDPIARPPK